MRLIPSLSLSLLVSVAGCNGGGVGVATPDTSATLPVPIGEVSNPIADQSTDPSADPSAGQGADQINGQAAASGLDALPVCGTVALAEVSRSLEPTQVPVLAKPTAGQRYADPTFAQCITRMTDHASEPPEGFARTAYSRKQAFNADDSRVLIMSGDGSWHLYDPLGVRHIARIAGLRGAVEPTWHPTRPDLLWHLPENGRGMRLLELNVLTGQQRVVGDLSRRLRARWPTATSAWTRSEGDASRDGRYWAWLVADAARRPLGIVTWDRTQDRILAMRDVDAETGRDLNWVSMSPGGQFVVAAGTARTLAFDRSLALHGILHDAVEHADLALDAQGNDVYVSVDFASREGWLFMVDIASLTRTDLVPMYNRDTGEVAFTSLHVSGKAYERPGWVLVSTYLTRSERTEWFQDKIMVVELAAEPRVRRLADHQSRYAGYWTEPHATPNADLSQVLFNSNWNSGSDTDVDTWRIELDPTLLADR